MKVYFGVEAGPSRRLKRRLPQGPSFAVSVSMAYFHFQLIRAEISVKCEHGRFKMRAATSSHEIIPVHYANKFYAAPAMQRDKLRVLETMKPNNPAITPSDLAFTVIHGDEKKRIAVNAEGTFGPVIDAQWAKDNPKVLTNMPGGKKAGFSFSIMPVVPAGPQLDYAELVASVKQSDALIKSQAGMMCFLMPTFAGIQMQFPRGHAATARITSGQGERTQTD